MAWVAVNRNGIESVYISKPERVAGTRWAAFTPINLPKGSIKKLIGRELKWEDEPVKLE